MAFLKFEDIDKSFGENNVISKFNLEVEKGKFIVLLGPSGCGSFVRTIWVWKIYFIKNDSGIGKNR